ncbi:hypothetical protein P3F01_15880 [Clostridium perfringens]|uniref:hypothetical protein n=1 Tax=Clostridium perfringens TaxID=1502 RepID=UPI0028E0F3B1|nr:hypothetical protein [Clostridium perfringens]MDT9337839.1 hypothetical protein [Clostridium perfringens]MDT9345596.1 hypothetical protein [Clostridium perfringens]MDT9346994.1 hypothetical protein [Clostridium perfringens]MDT9354682.1 hypothetical protein [Clostridium perfringens]
MEFKNVSFNINKWVKVRLSKKAKKYLEEERAKYGGKLVLDEEGYLHSQLWCLIQELGPIMNMCWSPIEKCEMIFEEIEIKDFEEVRQMRYIVNKKIFDTKKAEFVVGYRKECAGIIKRAELYRTKEGIWILVDTFDNNCTELDKSVVQEMFLENHDIKHYEKYFEKLEEF